MGRIGNHRYDDSSAAFKRNTAKNRRHLERKAAAAKQVNADTLDTIYECPVCEDGVSLGASRGHLARHRKLGEVSAELEDFVYGLEFVAAQVELQVLVHCQKCGVGIRQSRLARHESRCKAKKPKSKGASRAWNAADPEQDRDLPKFGSGSKDLFNTGRVVSGGGPGTGKRR